MAPCVISDGRSFAAAPSDHVMDCPAVNRRARTHAALASLGRELRPRAPCVVPREMGRATIAARRGRVWTGRARDSWPLICRTAAETRARGTTTHATVYAAGILRLPPKQERELVFSFSSQPWNESPSQLFLQLFKRRPFPPHFVRLERLVFFNVTFPYFNEILCRIIGE